MGFAQESNDGFSVRTTIQNGIIEGNYDTRTGVQKYFGIPFAEPPVGELRWKSPVPKASWEGVRAAKKFSPRPMQRMVFGDMDSWSDGVSEDCLYLNVWTPADRNTRDLPVLVYFYGGGFVAGDASEPRYNGESMAKKGMVVVTVNYRLNIFGFLSHPELSRETAQGGSGNYGLLDQALALTWVNENISAFGGSPEKVTIAGESAGSVSVSYQMASPLSKNLISGAIGESGAGIHPTLAPVSLEEGEAIGKNFLDQFDIPSIAALRKLPARDIYEMYNESGRFGFPIVVDGYFLPKTLPEIFGAGEQAQVPLLLGWNSAEIPGTSFMQGQPYEEAAFLEKIKVSFPEDYSKVLALYPHGTEREIEYAATALASDQFISYSTWKWFDLHRKNSDQRVYRYLYSKPRPPLRDDNLQAGLAGGTVIKDKNQEEAPKAIGAAHASEIEYCMGNLHLVDTYAWTSDDHKVSSVMQNYFANFILTGDPNGNEQPEWKPANADDLNPAVMVLDTDSKLIKAENDDRYLFLDSHYGNNK